MPEANLLKREVTNWIETDVLVVGGSPTGVAAAAAAAREGVRTLLVEQLGILGGQTTAGMVFTPGNLLFDGDGNRIVGGIAQELLYRARSLNPNELGWPDEAEKSWVENWIWPTALSGILEDVLRDARVDIILHGKAAGALVSDDSVHGAVFLSNGQLFGVKAKVTIDATGDAELTSLAGAECERRQGAREAGLHSVLADVDIGKFLSFLDSSELPGVRFLPDLSMETIRARYRENVSFSVICLHKLFEEGLDNGDFRLLDSMYTAPGFLWLRDDLVQTYCISKVGADPLDSVSLTSAELDCRRQQRILVDFYRKCFPGFEDCYTILLPATLGIRETRQLKGVYRLTEDDLRNNRIFPDAIGASAGHDEHGKSTTGHDIPYRSLLPAKLDGLLVAGRCISADAVARNSIRGIIPCIVSGQGAGVAAALAVKTAVEPRRVDIAALQERLTAQRVVLRKEKPQVELSPDEIGRT